MRKNKYVTYNFYHENGRYYILLHNQHIEVSIEVFNAYKNSIYVQDYSDRKYHKHNISLESNKMTAEQILAEQQFFATEEIYITEECNIEFLMRFKPKIRQTIILWLEGYNDKEVAEKIGISCRYVRQIRAQLRQQFR